MADYERIKEGMTLEEVEVFLGPASPCAEEIQMCLRDNPPRPNMPAFDLLRGDYFVFWNKPLPPGIYVKIPRIIVGLKGGKVCSKIYH